MRKRIVFILFLMVVLKFEAHAQARKPQSYALVIGISKYKDAQIPSLNFAHNDAEVFYQFALSPSGLNINPQQIKLLINEDATYLNVMDELDWLKSVAKKNDQVYIFFAGHGGIESEKLGLVYLLAQDSKHLQQYYRAISLSLIDETAKIISVEREAKIFVITDACHSGKLAASSLSDDKNINQQLTRIRDKNEVRITSCKELEESYEDKVWGDGRGVFSYFLIKGLAGEADAQKDGKITVDEISKFITDNIPEEVKTVKQKPQNPIVRGNATIAINQYKAGAYDEIMSKIKLSSQSTNSTISGSRGIIQRKDIKDFAREIIDEKLFDQNFDIVSLSKKSPVEIKKSLIKEYLKINGFNKKKLVKEDGYKTIAKVLYEKYLDHIDPYVCGSLSAQGNSLYTNVDTYLDELVYVIEIANKLLPADHYLVRMFTMQKNYLTGLSKRLKINAGNEEMVANEALVFQLKALEMAPEAAFVHNELGLLYGFKQDKEKAKFHFETAIDIAPLWSKPRENLAKLEE